jgi:hypothetical protein
MVFDRGGNTMSIDSNAELRSFGQYIEQLVASGNSKLTPEDALAQWRMENLSPEEYEEEVRAIQEALDDIAAGDKGVPWGQVIKDINAEFGLKPRR